MNKFYVWFIAALALIAAHLIFGFYFGVFAAIWTMHHWFIFPIMVGVFSAAQTHIGLTLWKAKNNPHVALETKFKWDWFAATSLFEIGLFGTVIGMAAAMFGAFAAIGAGAAMASVMAPLGSGMGTAFLSTASGLAYAWMVKLSLTAFFTEEEMDNGL
jgi:hypothetical protein